MIDDVERSELHDALDRALEAYEENAGEIVVDSRQKIVIDGKIVNVFVEVGGDDAERNPG